MADARSGRRDDRSVEPEPRDEQHAGSELAHESATERAHGTHGKGDDREELRTDGPVQPGGSEGSDTAKDLGVTRGSDAWGSEGSGGSVLDKRSPDKPRD